MKTFVTARKTIFFFPNIFKRCSFQKIALDYDLACIIKKDDISFSRKYNLIFYAQKERWSFSKSNWKYHVFFKYFKKMIFPNNSHLNMIFFYNIWKDSTAVFHKIWYFFFEDGKWKKLIFISCEFLASLKKMILVLENMVFLLKYHIDWHSIKSSRHSHWRYSIRKVVLRNFAKFTGKNLCQALFFNKVTGLRPATLLRK